MKPYNLEQIFRIRSNTDNFKFTFAISHVPANELGPLAGNNVSLRRNIEIVLAKSKMQRCPVVLRTKTCGNEYMKFHGLCRAWREHVKDKNDKNRRYTDNRLFKIVITFDTLRDRESHKNVPFDLANVNSYCILIFTNKPEINHIKLPTIPIRGDERKRMMAEIKNTSSRVFINNINLKASKETPLERKQCRNTTGSPNVMSEYQGWELKRSRRKEECPQLAECPFESIQIYKNDQSPKSRFVHKVENYPYVPPESRSTYEPQMEIKIELLNPNLHEIIQKMIALKIIGIMHIDASGGITYLSKCRKHANGHVHQRILNYFMVTNILNQTICLGEMITSMHSTAKISEFVQTFVNELDRYKNHPIKIVVLDFCWAEIYAVTRAFNKLDLVQYCNTIRMHFNNKKLLQKLICTRVALCVSHFTHLICTNVDKFANKFKKNSVPRHLRSFIIGIFCMLMNANDFNTIHEVYKYSLLIARSKNLTKPVLEAKKRLLILISKIQNKSHNDSDVIKQRLRNFENGLKTGNFIEVVNVNRQNTQKPEVKASLPQKKQIQTYTDFMEIAAKISVDNTAPGVQNPLDDQFNILYTLLERYVAYIILWSKIGTIDLIDKRLSNGEIEAYNSFIKSLMHLGDIPVPVDLHICRHYQTISANNLMVTDDTLRTMVQRKAKPSKRKILDDLPEEKIQQEMWNKKATMKVGHHSLFNLKRVCSKK